MLAELEDRRSHLRNRHATRFQRDLLPAVCRDLTVNVELGAAVGAEVDVVHAPERPLELRSADRPLKIKVKTRTLGWWRLPARKYRVGRGAILDYLCDLRPVLVDQFSGHPCFMTTGIQPGRGRAGHISGVHWSLLSWHQRLLSWPAYRSGGSPSRHVPRSLRGK